jgi:hypothetical protein
VFWGVDGSADGDFWSGVWSGHESLICCRSGGKDRERGWPETTDR